MSSWLDLAFGEPQPAAVAQGFGVVFRMMLAAVDAADVRLLLSYDEQWATTLPQADVGRFDYLGDVVADAHSTLIAGEGSAAEEHTRAVRDALRLLRAVYRFGLAAWILDTAVRAGGSPERRLAAQHMAAHFGDVGVLTFVAGRAITVSDDRRLAWWTLLFEPREYDRVVVTSFAPALCTAYMTMLMDLPEQPLPPRGVDRAVPEPAWRRDRACLAAEHRAVLLGGRAGRRDGQGRPVDRAATQNPRSGVARRDRGVRTRTRAALSAGRAASRTCRAVYRHSPAGVG